MRKMQHMVISCWHDIKMRITMKMLRISKTPQGSFRKMHEKRFTMITWGVWWVNLVRELPLTREGFPIGLWTIFMSDGDFDWWSCSLSPLWWWMVIIFSNSKEMFCWILPFMMIRKIYPNSGDHHDIPQWKHIEGIEVAHHVHSIPNCPGGGLSDL